MADDRDAASRRAVRDRHVVIAAVLIVATVLATAWLSGLVPALGSAIARAPLIMAVLVAVTLVVLARALLRRRG